MILHIISEGTRFRIGVEVPDKTTSALKAGPSIFYPFLSAASSLGAVLFASLMYNGKHAHHQSQALSST